ncbi:type II secretion system F family protein, partial [Streptomyces sp. JAC128]
MGALLLWVLAGLALSGGVVGLVAGIVGTTRPKGSSVAARLRVRTGYADQDARARRRNMRVAGVVVGSVLWLVTGVFVLGVLVVLAAVGVPWL